VPNFHRSNSKPGTAEANSPTYAKTPIVRKNSQEIVINQSTSQHQAHSKPHLKKHNIERIDMNVESIITETLLQSQQNAKREAELNRLKRQSPDLDEHIEEDIIVYQNNKSTHKDSMRYDNKSKIEKNTANSDAFTIYAQIQKRNNYSNESNNNNFANSNRLIVLTNEIQKKNEDATKTDDNNNNRLKNGDTVIYQNSRSQKQQLDNPINKKVSSACENNFHSDNSVVSDKATIVGSCHKNLSSSRGVKADNKNEANIVNLNTSQKNKEKIAVEVQQFSTELKPHQDSNLNRLQLLQNKLKDENHNVLQKVYVI